MSVKSIFFKTQFDHTGLSIYLSIYPYLKKGQLSASESCISNLEQQGSSLQITGQKVPKFTDTFTVLTFAPHPLTNRHQRLHVLSHTDRLVGS